VRCRFGVIAEVVFVVVNGYALPHPWQTKPFAVTFPVSVVLRFPQHTHRVLPGIFATPAMTARLAVFSLNWLFETGSPRL
jgi:hypothetical protein